MPLDYRERKELRDYLGGTNTAGGKLKAGGESGFNALLTGYRCTMSGNFSPGYTFNDNDIHTYFWTSEQSDAENAYFWEILQSSR